MIRMGGKEYRRYQSVADAIAHQIRTGTYRHGDRLSPERELGEEFGVSRPTIREALIALEIMGYVEVRGRSGIYVKGEISGSAELDPGVGPFEVLEARKMIESDIAAVAARSITASQLSELHRNMERQIKQLEAGRPFSENDDMRFHMLIAEATGNGALHFVVEQLWKIRSRSDIWRVLDERLGMKRMQHRAAEDHIAILARIEARDPDAAYEAMSRHMQNNIDWRLEGFENVPSSSERDRRTKLRLMLEREMARSIEETGGQSR